jgi:hypothetical protein
MSPRSPSPRAPALGLGLAAAVLFVLLASVRIEAQGTQYDELHQAVGAFTWLGAPPPPIFCMAVRGVCVLNMPYSAAIKTNLYGAWLRLTESRFTLASWRMFGILAIAAGIVLFCALSGPALPPWAVAVFLALLLTDGAVLLAGRFDWGPAALSLALRLALLGLWIGSEAGEAPTLRSSFGLGALVGFAVFEKLSSIVLVPPLAAMVLGSTGRRERRHLLAGAAGLAAGALPLAAVHLGSLLLRGQPVSLGSGPEVSRSPAGFLAYLGDYLTLGRGGIFRSFTLGVDRLPWADLLEGTIAAAVCAVVAAAVALDAMPSTRRAGIALAGYGAVCLGLYFLPRPTWAHHWLLGTPFQYAAVALALPALRRGEGRRRVLGLALAALVSLWLVTRLPGLVETERALAAGRASSAWDPSLAEIGRFAAERPAGTVFVASEWGVATQILAFSGGRPDLVYEPFWRYQGPEQLRRIQEESGARVLYLVRLRNPPRTVPGAMQRIERDLAADPRWREVPVEPEAARLKAVLVRKLVRS